MTPGECIVVVRAVSAGHLPPLHELLVHAPEGHGLIKGECGGCAAVALYGGSSAEVPRT